MTFEQIAVATMTLAHSFDEEVALRNALRALADVRLRVTPPDGGSSPAFKAFVGSLPGFGVETPTEPGLVGQVKTSVQSAAVHGTPFVLYTEPDKEPFFTTGLREFVAKAPSASDVGVVLASRS